VSGGTPGFEIVALIEGLTEVIDLGFLSSSAINKVVDNKGGFGHQSFHGRLNLSKQRLKLGFFSNRLCMKALADFQATALRNSTALPPCF
jgi:hypothetical protein